MSRRALTPEGREIARLRRLVQQLQLTVAEKDAAIAAVKVAAFDQNDALIKTLGDIVTRLNARATDAKGEEDGR